MTERPTGRRTLHEAAHKAEREAAVEGESEAAAASKSPSKRILNESAHKLGYWGPPGAETRRDDESEATRKRFEALADSQRDVIAHAGRAVLALGALGVVYG